jgi:hypothetical protein
MSGVGFVFITVMWMLAVIFLSIAVSTSISVFYFLGWGVSVLGVFVLGIESERAGWSKEMK